ncbi:sugar kinase [Thaumasiovibrio subtropicus]|uniref:sugar kinase n=1 Tax=Thaumasiovibrio subtropicus TaxID=1891207 RepID=UPI000B35FA79|nr:sugar kinase [Thaumasiovibrio subtropicus]
MITDRKFVLVTRKTRLMELKEKYCTLGQAKFYLEHLGESFDQYEDEHQQFLAVKQNVQRTLFNLGRVLELDRELLPTYLFQADDIVVVLGQDGLVANTLKYLTTQPVIAINPLPALFDGILLPFKPSQVRDIVLATLNQEVRIQAITLAEATTNLGHSMLAVNDLFIGPRSHTSARYRLEISNASEEQCSSGIIVSTGLGSTGWMKSIITGACAIAGQNNKDSKPVPWDEKSLTYAVREPFPSATSQCAKVFGRITPRNHLTLTSRMPENGVIFSDGLEQDAIAFNAGTVATISISASSGSLVLG